MRILVTGKNGQLGRSIQKIVNTDTKIGNNQSPNDFIFVGREELNLSSESSISHYFDNNDKFDIIINCAAYTAVDKAEKEQELANQVNHLAVKQLAKIANNQQARLIHISTDYVFDGESDKPYIETDTPNPINIYGKTKLAGEIALQELMPTNVIIIRTSSLYSEFINENVIKGIEEKLDCSTLKNEELTKLFMRLNFFGKRKEIAHLSDPYFEKYMRTLHQFNNNQISAIKEVYFLVQESARRWYGDPKKTKKVVVNLGRNQSKYRVFKDFKAVPDFKKPTPSTDELLTKFVQEFTLYFKLDNSNTPIRININFGLYEILNRILNGYRPNKKDTNNYISFVNLINKLINQDNDAAALEIDEVNIGKAADYELIKDSFGEYKFRAL